MVRWLLKFADENKVLFSKYALIGFLAAVIDFSILYCLTEFAGLHYLASATISFIFAALFNYYFNRRWTFASDGSHKKQLPIFFIIAGLGILINNGILLFGVETLGLWYIYAKLFATATVTIWNFLGNKYITFRVK